MTTSPHSRFRALLFAASSFVLSACSADSMHRLGEMMESASQELALQLAGEDTAPDAQAVAPEELTEEELMALAMLLSEQGLIEYGPAQQAYPQVASGQNAGPLGAWTGGSLPSVNYDPYSYQNPDSVDYDPYEVDSEGWSGGAYENPDSSYYDPGSYDTGSYDTGSYDTGSYDAGSYGSYDY